MFAGTRTLPSTSRTWRRKRSVPYDARSAAHGGARRRTAAHGGALTPPYFDHKRRLCFASFFHSSHQGIRHGDKKIIAVLGSTGAQGGSLCRFDPRRRRGRLWLPCHHARYHKDKAKALATRRAGGQGRSRRRRELKKAFAGAYGVYAVTNFWSTSPAKKKRPGQEYRRCREGRGR